MLMKSIKVTYNSVEITRWYSDTHPIWNLDPEKQERQCIADVIRDLTIRADELAQIKVVERG